MSYETVVYFDSVYFLESLRPGDLKTGTELFENVVRPWSVSGGGIAAARSEVHTAAELYGQLDLIASHVTKYRRAPVLHIDAHGSDDGLQLSSDEIISWEALAEPLARINHACRFNLVVISSTCFGWYMIKALNPTSRAPAWGIIGPPDKIQAGILYDAGKAFYETLFKTTDLRKAVGAMNPGLSYKDWTIKVQPAELLFCRLFNIYLREIATAENDEKRAARIVAQIAPKLGLKPDQIAPARTRMTTILQNHQSWFDHLRRRFLMLDAFPENETRFPVTYEQCSKSAA